ncbi:MAG TPA: hypothetical protein VLG50_04435 [Candidatus Saccharimonadales bacterium]|nr:hypothetical protein [Candidatus Saccharimonadales bacterium]
MKKLFFKRIIFILGFAIFAHQTIPCAGDFDEPACLCGWDNLSIDEKVAINLESIMKQIESYETIGYMSYNSGWLAGFIDSISTDMSYGKPKENPVHIKVFETLLKLFIKKGMNVHQKFESIFGNNLQNITLMHKAITVDESVVQVLINNGFKVDQDEELDILCFAQAFIENINHRIEQEKAFYDSLLRTEKDKKEQEYLKRSKTEKVQIFLDQCKRCVNAVQLFLKQCHPKAKQKFLKKYPNFEAIAKIA